MDEKEAEARPAMGTIFLVYTRKMVPIMGASEVVPLSFQKQDREEGETE